MLNRLHLGLSLLLAFVGAGPISEGTVPANRDPDSTLLLFGMRHGNRNPENFINPDDGSWGLEGALELTKFGKRQAVAVGREVRRFAGKDYLNENYFGKESVFYSSSAPRCQMTLQACTAGLYTPTGWADWSSAYDHWSPIPYTIDDPLLRMYSVKDCPNSDKAWAPISDDTWSPLAKMAEEKADLLKYMANSTGWDAQVAKAADVADNIILIQLYKAKYPKWIEEPTLSGYDREKLIEAYLEFAEAHQNACAENEECRKMMGGYWLKHILDSIHNAQAGKGPKVIGYASHTEVTLAVMKLMGYTRNELPTTAGFVIEFKNTPKPMVRLLDHDPILIDDHVIQKAAVSTDLAKLQDANGFILLEDFEKIVGGSQISDWEGACGRVACKKA